MILDLLRSTGLLTQLKSATQVTLFAPTNNALMKIPQADFEDLKADTQRLTELLQYHVTTDMGFHTNGRANDLVLTSLHNNLPIRINIYGLLHIYAAEGKNITERDLRASNGYVQGLDDLMIPPTGDVVDILTGMDKTK